MSNPSLAITLDIDWAPDFMIEDVARLLINKRVRATWFVTHATPALDLLRQYPELFELGIHPNFKEGSSHGKSMPEIVQHCLTLVPDAVSARSHGLIQSDYLWRYYLEATPIRCDCTTYAGPVPHVYISRFYWKSRALTRIPFVYQDNMEMEAPTPIWSAETFYRGKSGVQSLNFHPVYIYTNARSMSVYEFLKTTGKPFSELLEADVRPHRLEGAGTRYMFESALDYFARHGGGKLIREVKIDAR